jgi:hypothetical protein
MQADDAKVGQPWSARRCPNCDKDRPSNWFKRADPEGQCAKCYRAAQAIVDAPRDVVDIKLGPHSVLRVWTVGGMVALTSGKMVERLSSESMEFVGSATVALSFKALTEVSAALTQFARSHRKAARVGA